MHVVIALEVHEVVTLIFPGKALEDAILVLPNAMLQVARNPDVEHARTAAHDVDGVAVFLHVAALYEIC